MKVGYIVIWQLVLVVPFEKQAKMRLRKTAKRKNLAQEQTHRWNRDFDAGPSRGPSYRRLLLLLNTFCARGAVFLGLAWFAIASHSQKRRDGWKNLNQKQTNRWNWALDFISSPECSYGCPVLLLNTFGTVRATAEPFFMFLLLYEHRFRCLVAWRGPKVALRNY